MPAAHAHGCKAMIGKLVFGEKGLVKSQLRYQAVKWVLPVSSSGITPHITPIWILLRHQCLHSICELFLYGSWCDYLCEMITPWWVNKPCQLNDKSIAGRCSRERHMEVFSHPKPLLTRRHHCFKNKTVFRFYTTMVMDWLGLGTKTTWLGLGKGHGLKWLLLLRSRDLRRHCYNNIHLVMVREWPRSWLKTKTTLTVGRKRKMTAVSRVKVQQFIDPSIRSNLLPLWTLWLYNNFTLLPPLLLMHKSRNSYSRQKALSLERKHMSFLGCRLNDWCWCLLRVGQSRWGLVPTVSNFSFCAHYKCPASFN